MKEYSIYRNNSIIYQFVVDDTISTSLSGNKYISFTITSKQELDINIGDYIKHDNEIYELFEPIDIEESNGVFTYPLTFYFQGYKLNNSIITDEGATTFAYHGEVSDFMILLINSLRVDYPDFHLGNIENGSILDLNFDNSNCMAALQTVCENAEMEWDITGTVITVKRRIGEETDYIFEYGKNKGSYSVKLSKVANASITTRMIGKGGTINLPSDYASPDSPKRLNLGEEVIEKNVKKYGRITGVYINENIYPRLINKTVLGVNVPENIEEAGSWKIKLDIPFNLSEYYAENEVPIVKFQTGDLTGLDFEIVENSWNNTNKTLSIIVKEEEDGYYVPNKDRQPRIGDVFVLLNINMPQSYIDEATQELREATQNELSKKCEPQYAPSLSVQKHYIKKKGISLNIGDGITVKIGSRRITTRIIGLTETSDDIRVELGDQMLYTYDTKVNNTIEQIQFTLKQLTNMDDIKRLFYNLINAWYPQWFNQKLHKEADVQFNSVQSDNFSSKNFRSGPLGEGHQIKDGNAEFQNVTVRGKISAFEYLIQQVKAVGGKLIISAASMKAGVVEELEDGYKCYFNTDGGTIHNQFVVNDQAFHQVFNGKNQSRYWRLITEVGSDYIVLSKTDCEADSDIPQVDDEILLLGNRTDINRMSAIILSAYDENSPYTAYYSGINSFSLEGKESMREGNLNGIVDKDFGQLAGFGLFANNVFLKGQFWLTSGKTVEQSITDEIDGIHIGGTNILQNTTSEWVDSRNAFPQYLAYDNYLPLKAGQEITISAYIKGISAQAEQIYIEYEASDANNNLEYGYLITKERGDFEIKLQSTFTLKREINKIKVYPIFRSPNGGEVSGNIQTKEVKLELGNKPTSWSPSPKDTQKQFAELKVGVDGIKSTVTSFQEALDKGIGGRNLAIYNTSAGNNMYLDGETFKTTTPDTRTYFDFKVSLYNGNTYIESKHTDPITTLGRHYLKFTTPNQPVTRMSIGHNGAARDCSIYFANPLFKPNTNYIVGLDLVKFEGGDIQFKNVKIEEGSIPTTFVKSPEDTEQEQNIYNNTFKGWIDASNLDQNTYYPVTIYISPSWGKATIRTEVALNSNTKPSWSIHNAGFSVFCEWTAYGSGWGVQDVGRVINDYRKKFANGNVIGSIQQLTYSSQEVVYVRGGGRYYFTCLNAGAPVLRTTSYTWENGPYSQTAPLLTSVTEPSPTLQSQITQLSTEIDLRVVKKGNIISQINVSTEGVKINANKLNINGVISANGNFIVDTNGNLTANNANLTGKINATSGKIGDFEIKEGYAGSGTGLYIGTNEYSTFLTKRTFRVSKYSSTEQIDFRVDSYTGAIGGASSSNNTSVCSIGLYKCNASRFSCLELSCSNNGVPSGGSRNAIFVKEGLSTLKSLSLNALANTYTGRDAGIILFTIPGITFTLPKSIEEGAVTGRVIIFRNASGGRCTISGPIVTASNSNVTSTAIENKSLHFFIHYGGKWYQSYTN